MQSLSLLENISRKKKYFLLNHLFIPLLNIEKNAYFISKQGNQNTCLVNIYIPTTTIKTCLFFKGYCYTTISEVTYTKFYNYIKDCLNKKKNIQLAVLSHQGSLLGYLEWSAIARRRNKVAANMKLTIRYTEI